MKLTALALSTVLLCSTGAFAQTNAPATSPNNGSSMSNTQPGDTNGAATPNTTPNDMNNTMPMNDNGQRHHHGWGWIGLFGLLGLFGMGGRRTRDDVVTPTATRPRV